MSALSDEQRDTIRLVMGYHSRSGSHSWRFYRQAGLLDFRMGNLSNAEIVIVTRYLDTIKSLEDRKSVV